MMQVIEANERRTMPVLKAMKEQKLCRHLAVIMDGNRRFGRTLIQNEEMAGLYGHLMGAGATVELIWWWMNTEEVKSLSLFALGLNNLKRNERELEAITDLIMQLLKTLKRSEVVKRKGVRIKVAGNRELMDPRVRKEAEDAEEKTKENGEKTLYLCVWYDGDDEIRRAGERAAEAGERLSLKHFDVPEEVDLLIRPAERRLSGFLPYQSEHAEIRFYKKMFPAMTSLDWNACLADYHGTERRLGK